jgi:hypothetical protein
MGYREPRDKPNRFRTAQMASPSPPRQRQVTQAVRSDSDEDDREPVSSHADMKKLKSDYEETHNIMKLIKEFEKDYTSAKASLNSYDEKQLEADTWAQVMAHCYKIVKDNIHRDQPNFDKDKME